MTDPETDAVAAYLTAAAVRERSSALTRWIEDGRSEAFRLHRDKLPEIADRVAALTTERFGNSPIPLHSRWRHFKTGGVDRFGALARVRDWAKREDAARAMADLAIVSVLTDAGAGPAWRFTEPSTGKVFSRSEGLALASLALFASGALSAVPADPLRVDAAALESLSEEEFSAAFQVSIENFVAGAQSRYALLTDLAGAVRADDALFASADDPRPGGIVDALAAEAGDTPLPAATILSFVLEGLGSIWPSRNEIAGLGLGDTFGHPAVGLVPFHKLSTWLSLSLIEPLQVRGVNVVEHTGLPGLAEYRNGGLFIDGGVLEPLFDTTQPLAADHPAVVEWRAATVTLLDAMVPLVSVRLDRPLTLPQVLEGGTWVAGRQIAREKRPDGTPPVTVRLDGTIF